MSRVEPREHTPDCRTRIRPINQSSGYRSIFREPNCPRCVALVACLEECRRRREAREASS